MCSLLGIAGYLCFGDATEAEILDNFPSTSGLANGMKVMVTVHLLLYIPIDFVIMRHSMTLLFDTEVLELSTVKYVGLNVGLVCACLAITLSTKEFGVILDLTGGVTGSFLYFMLPALLERKVLGGSVMSTCLLLFGFLALVATLVGVITG
jgi:sodium-coupled neutral amino acid transporter 11